MNIMYLSPFHKYAKTNLQFSLQTHFFRNIELRIIKYVINLVLLYIEYTHINMYKHMYVCKIANQIWYTILLKLFTRNVA